ncbi:putative branched-chain amino acid transport ATP-binding protein LivF [[Clostridium] ultunense Esp]|nr:putative branched-chain amino acid transport ATP-binding protein LivF [[Clostridium] ultunense Esp]
MERSHHNIHLKLDGVETYIGQFHILQGVSLEAEKGKITVLLGRNGAGKTTTLRTIMGLNKAYKGSILFEGEEIHRLSPYQISRRGIGYIPEDQGIFAGLTVEENMKIAMGKMDLKKNERLEWILSQFSDLKKAWKKKGGALSGGQKQMLAIARAYMNDNRILLIDEPSKGLAPVMVETLMESLVAIKRHTTILLVEQNFIIASRIGDRFVIIDDGRTVKTGEMEELTGDDLLKRKYLGIA